MVTPRSDPPWVRWELGSLDLDRLAGFRWVKVVGGSVRGRGAAPSSVPWGRRVLNELTQEGVASLTSSMDRHGPHCQMRSVLSRLLTVLTGALS